MQHLAKAAAAAAVLAITAVPLQASATPTPPAAPDSTWSPELRADNLPNPLADKRRAEKINALNAVLAGEAQVEVRGESTGVMLGETFVQTTLRGEDGIFVLLTEFGAEIDEMYGGSVGPGHNEIAQPDRAVDNTTIWQQDYNRAHYEKMYGETADAGYPSVANFVAEQSSGKYTLRARVSDWVQLEYNEARYGSNLDQTETYWAWVTDAVNSWWDQSCAGGNEDGCNVMLAELDKWDRYDWDDDGSYDEPDGYLDHLQLVHAGVAEELGGGAQGDDAIASHRWYVNGTDVGLAGPVPPGSAEPNLLGGTRIGDSPWWVGDYTAQPENGGQGVLAHEYMHDLDLPDLSGTDGVENDTGFWTLMGSGAYSSAGEDAIVGDRAGGLSAWEKAFLGWVTPDDGSLYVARPGEQEVTLGPAAPRAGDLPQAAVVNLPGREVTVQTAEPYAGERSWWSGYGDLLAHSLQTSEPLDLSSTSDATLTAWVSYDIEAGHDHVFGEVSTDSGSSWTRLNGSVAGQPVWGDGDVEGLTGSSDASWVPLSYDLSVVAGQPRVLFRFSYETDAGLAPRGFFADEIRITADGVELLYDGAETEAGGPWTPIGFTAAGAAAVATEPQRYWVENRQLTGADIGLESGPYNVASDDEPGLVEHFGYESGPLVWYNWDAFDDNNVGAHPGVGINLPVDVRAEALQWKDDANAATSEDARPRLQSRDASLSLVSTAAVTLRRGAYDSAGNPAGVEQTTFDALAARPTFDDVSGSYWDQEYPNHGVILAPTGTQVELVSTQPVPDASGVSATLRILAPALTPTSASPTTPAPSTHSSTQSPTAPSRTSTPPTTGALPGTGGGRSSMLAGLGLAAVLGGGLLVALAARRLRQDG